MVALEPEQRVAHEEALHLVAAVVELVAVPVGLDPLTGVGVLVEVGAVEEGEAVRVAREVRRHPVEDDADAPLVQVVHEEHEVLRRSVARGGCVVPRDLVAPRSVERVLHHRHELHVGEAEPLDVVGEAGRDLAVGQVAVPLLGDTGPRAEVHLVDRDRAVDPCGLGPPGHPRGVAPLVVEVPDHRCRPRRDLGVEGERVGLLVAVAAEPGGDEVLVDRPPPDPDQEPLPDAGLTDRPQRVALPLPGVEVADHRHRRRVGGPDREVGAPRAVGLDRMGAELGVQGGVATLVEEVQVEGAEQAELRRRARGDGRRRRCRTTPAVGQDPQRPHPGRVGVELVEAHGGRHPPALAPHAAGHVLGDGVEREVVESHHHHVGGAVGQRAEEPVEPVPEARRAPRRRGSPRRWACRGCPTWRRCPPEPRRSRTGRTGTGRRSSPARRGG